MGAPATGLDPFAMVAGRTRLNCSFDQRVEDMWRKRISGRLIALVYPQSCLICRDIFEDSADDHEFDFGLCRSCRDQICGNLLDRCYTCGATTHKENPFGRRCALCRNVPLHFDRAVAVGNYSGLLRETVVSVKRQLDDVMSLQFGRLLGSCLLEKFGIQDSIDLVVPIPIHWRRKIKRRGFHGSDVIAEGIAASSGLKKSRRALVSTRATTKQGTLSIRQRFQNVKGAFAVRRSVRLQDLQILLVDDVMTSGATASEAAKVLLKAGASKVFVAVVARGARMS